jgi:putative two-component system response regulator
MDEGVTHLHGAPRVLVVDDEAPTRNLFAKLLRQEGYVVDLAPDGPSAQAALATDPPDLLLLDVILPGVSGFDVCRQVKRDPTVRLTPVILVTGLTDRDNRIEGRAAGADDFLTKPIDREELLARVRSLVRMKRYTDDLDSVTSFIMMLAVMIEIRDGCSEGHCHRMANYATALGRRVGLNEDDLQALNRGGFLHDIGMLAIPDAVLRKPGALDAEEHELVKSHTMIGDALCANTRSLQAVRPIVRHHHERLDGSGYPDGLHGDQIPLLAQIVGVVDVFDALTSPRAYHAPMPRDQAVEVLRSHVRMGWRPRDLVEPFATIAEGGDLDTFTKVGETHPDHL